MLTGFLALAFNPQAWIAIGMALTLGFSSGVYKGWNSANVRQWEAQVLALTLAAKQKDEQIARDARFAAEDSALASAREADLQKVINETNRDKDACKLTASESGSLRKLATGNRRRN